MKKLLLLFPLFLVSCNDPMLTKVSKGLADYSVAIHGVETSVIQANQQGVLTVDQTRPIVQLLVKLNSAGQQASALTRNLTTLPAASKSQLVTITAPVITAIEQAISSGLFGIPDGAVKSNILLSLNAALLALNTIEPLLTASAERSFSWDSQLSYSC
jgi:hypothetical protein